MENSRIADLLRPFVGAGEISPALLDQLRTYLDLLLKWNARVNLTAVRGPGQIVHAPLRRIALCCAVALRR